MRGLPSVLLFMMLLSCSGNNGKPKDFIRPEKMKLVLWDIIKADVYAGQILQKGLPEDDTLVTQQYQQVIFDHYHISRDQFLRNYRYYYKNQELMTALLDSITAMRQKPSLFRSKINNLNDE